MVHRWPWLSLQKSPWRYFFQLIQGKYFHLGCVSLVIRAIKYLDDHEMLQQEHEFSKKFEAFFSIWNVLNVGIACNDTLWPLSRCFLSVQGLSLCTSAFSAQMSQWNVSSVISKLQPPSTCMAPHLMRVSMMQIGFNTKLLSKESYNNIQLIRNASFR